MSDFNFGGFVAGERVLDGNRMRREVIESTKLLALLENLIAGNSVQGEGGKDSYPRRAIDKRYAHSNPFDGDPAPERGRPIYLASGRNINKEIDGCDDKGQSIAHDMVFPFQCFQLLSIVLFKQGQVDIDGHAQVPQCIGGKKPSKVNKLHNVERFLRYSHTFGSKSLGTDRDVNLSLL